MESDRQITLAILHDLALLYLGLAHGSDEELAASETREIAIKLRGWLPDKDPALIDHVLREATLTYLNRNETNRLEQAIGSLREKLDEGLRRAILLDLVDIARADGRVLEAEGGFIRDVAAQWGIDFEKELRES